MDSPRFRGHLTARLDAKGRLRIPTKLKDVLSQKYPSEEALALVLTKSEDHLVAYPPEEWDKLETKLIENLSQFNSSHQSFVRNFISSAEVCELDSQGRILIPPVLRETAQLDQELFIVGMLTTFEIWNKAAFDLQAENYKENGQKIMESIPITGF